MGWKQAVKLVGLFVTGWAATAAAAKDPGVLSWDWQAMTAGILAAGFTIALVPTAASPMIQILATLGSFLLGWGTAQSGIGYRYVMFHFDYRALLSGLAGIGLVHSGNPGNPLGAAVAKFEKPPDA